MLSLFLFSYKETNFKKSHNNNNNNKSISKLKIVWFWVLNIIFLRKICPGKIVGDLAGARGSLHFPVGHIPADKSCCSWAMPLGLEQSCPLVNLHLLSTLLGIFCYKHSAERLNKLVATCSGTRFSYNIVLCNVLE